MQGKLCHPENECEPPPEFVFLAFDGKIVQEHGKKKVPENNITDIYFISQNSLKCLPPGQTLHAYPKLPFPDIMMVIMHAWKRLFIKLKRFSNLFL